MKYLPIVLVVILIVLLIATWGPVESYSRVDDPNWVSAEKNNVLPDIERLMDGYRNLDVQPFLDLAHPNVLLSEGGSESIRMLLEPQLDSIRDGNGSFELFEGVGEPEFYKTKYDDIVVVRTRAIVSSPSGRTQLTGFFVGHKKQKDKHWKYLDATGGLPEAEDVVRFHLPELPAGLRLPKSSRERMPSMLPDE